MVKEIDQIKNSNLRTELLGNDLTRSIDRSTTDKSKSTRDKILNKRFGILDKDDLYFKKWVKHNEDDTSE